MPELRRDPVTGRWVVIAPERSLRPRELRRTPQLVEAFCPFCPGHESATGEALRIVPNPAPSDQDSPWLVRVVPNRFPALRVEGALDPRGDGVYDHLNGIGAHEVIIETPHHEACWSTMPMDQVMAVLRVYQERIGDLKRDQRLRYVLVFKNKGALAGATLVHPHSQVIALPLVPLVIEQELCGSERHFSHRGRCLFCDIARQELRDGTRLVYHSDAVVGFAPYASRFPFEVWCMPRAHQTQFEASGDADLEAMAGALRHILGRLGTELGDPAYNLVIHTSPAGMDDSPYYHWHIEITPILYHPSAGFELGSGYHINPTLPETAAACLRKTDRWRQASADEGVR